MTLDKIKNLISQIQLTYHPPIFTTNPSTFFSSELSLRVELKIAQCKVHFQCFFALSKVQFYHFLHFQQCKIDLVGVRSLKITRCFDEK